MVNVPDSFLYGDSAQCLTVRNFATLTNVSVVLRCTCCKAAKLHRYHSEHYKYKLMYVHLSNGRQTLDRH